MSDDDSVERETHSKMSDAESVDKETLDNEFLLRSYSNNELKEILIKNGYNKRISSLTKDALVKKILNNNCTFDKSTKGYHSRRHTYNKKGVTSSSLSIINVCNADDLNIDLNDCQLFVDTMKRYIQTKIKEKEGQEAHSTYDICFKNYLLYIYVEHSNYRDVPKILNGSLKLCAIEILKGFYSKIIPCLVDIVASTVRKYKYAFQYIINYEFPGEEYFKIDGKDSTFRFILEAEKKQHNHHNAWQESNSSVKKKDPLTTITTTLRRFDVETIFQLLVTDAYAQKENVDFLLTLTWNFKCFTRFSSLLGLNLNHVKIEQDLFRGERITFLMLIIEKHNIKTSDKSSSYPSMCYRDMKYELCAQFFLCFKILSICNRNGTLMSFYHQQYEREEGSQKRYWGHFKLITQWEDRFAADSYYRTIFKAAKVDTDKILHQKKCGMYEITKNHNFEEYKIKAKSSNEQNTPFLKSYCDPNQPDITAAMCGFSDDDHYSDIERLDYEFKCINENSNVLKDLFFPCYHNWVREWNSKDGCKDKCSNMFLFDTIPYVIKVLTQDSILWVSEHPEHIISKKMIGIFHNKYAGEFINWCKGSFSDMKKKRLNIDKVKVASMDKGLQVHHQLLNKAIVTNHSDMNKVLCSIKDELKDIKSNQGVLIRNQIKMSDFLNEKGISSSVQDGAVSTGNSLVTNLDQNILSSTSPSPKYSIVTNANLCFKPNFVTHSTIFTEYVHDWFYKKLYLYQNHHSKHGWEAKFKTGYTRLCQIIFIIDYKLQEYSNCSISNNDPTNQEYRDSMTKMATLMDNERPDKSEMSFAKYNEHIINSYKSLYNQSKRSEGMKRQLVQKKTITSYFKNQDRNNTKRVKHEDLDNPLINLEKTNLTQDCDVSLTNNLNIEYMIPKLPEFSSSMNHLCSHNTDDDVGQDNSKSFSCSGNNINLNLMKSIIILDDNSNSANDSNRYMYMQRELKKLSLDPRKKTVNIDKMLSKSYDVNNPFTTYSKKIKTTEFHEIKLWDKLNDSDIKLLKRIEWDTEKNLKKKYFYFNHEFLTVSDIKKIDSKEWFNSSIINSFLELVKTTYPCLSYKKLMIDSFFLTIICLYIQNETYNYEHLVNVLRNKYGTDNLFLYQKIYIISNVEDLHWYLIVLEPKINRITIYDSCGARYNEKHKVHSECLVKFLNEHHREIESVDEKTVLTDWCISYALDIPQQLNGYDCGPFVCGYIYNLWMDFDLNFTRNDIATFRKKVLISLMTQIYSRSCV